MIRLAFIAGVLLVTIPAQATILRFMPGDAFFHSRLTHEVIDSISDEGSTIVLPYRGPDHAMAGLCGYAGFEALEIRYVPPEIARGLKDFYRSTSFPRTVEITTNAEGEVIGQRELFAYRLIITVKEFEPGVQKFGLKYNENWHSPPPEAMKPDGRSTLNTPAAVYECYVKGQDAVALDWKDGPVVPALPVRVEPYAAWGVTGARIEQPAIVDASDVRFFILEDRNMRDISADGGTPRSGKSLPMPSAPTSTTVGANSTNLMCRSTKWNEPSTRFSCGLIRKTTPEKTATNRSPARQIAG